MSQKIYVVSVILYDDNDMFDGFDIEEDAFTTMEAARVHAYTLVLNYAIDTGKSRRALTRQLDDPETNEFEFDGMSAAVSQLNLK
jgi:hypothetical protein